MYIQKWQKFGKFKIFVYTIQACFLQSGRLYHDKTFPVNSRLVSVGYMMENGNENDCVAEPWGDRHTYSSKSIFYHDPIDAYAILLNKAKERLTT